VPHFGAGVKLLNKPSFSSSIPAVMSRQAAEMSETTRGRLGWHATSVTPNLNLWS
jgi:hypothetical protein